MKRNYIIFISLLTLGIILRFVAFSQLEWFFQDTLHVDEITYVTGDSPPFERPPATYLLAQTLEKPIHLRILFSIISLLPAILFFTLREKNTKNSIIAGLLAVEPTLLFSGLQILPEAPAAALLTAALLTINKKSYLSAWLIGTAALFRGELLLFIPVSFFFIKPFKKYLTTTIFILIPLLPVFIINLTSGGDFALAQNGSMNIWLGSNWSLLETPPGLEFEQLMKETDFRDLAKKEILKDIPGWLGRGAIKTAAFLSLPGPGRNIEAPRLINETVLKLFLPITLLFLALGLSSIRKNTQSALIVTALISAFVFFPSIRHRAVFIPTLALLATNYRKKTAAIIALVIILTSLFLNYPARVRTGLTEVQLAQNELQNNNFHEAINYLNKAEQLGYRGADLHSIRGATITSSGGDFQAAAREFATTLELVPNSPSAWKNMAVLLYNYGHYEDASYAAEKAINLNQNLRPELTPILQHSTP